MEIVRNRSGNPKAKEHGVRTEEEKRRIREKIEDEKAGGRDEQLWQKKII